MSLATVSERAHRLGQVQAEKLAKISELETEAGALKADMESKQLELAPFIEYLDRKDAIIESYTRLTSLQGDLARTENQRAAAIAAHEQLAASALLHRKGLTFYSKLLDEITESYVLSLQKSLNEVYSFVFQNPMKSVKLAMEDRYNKKVLVLRLLNYDGTEVHEEGLDSSGYSVSVVLGTILLVYFILYNHLERIIFFDESISGLSAETSARFFSLLRVFVEQLGFRFCLISHEARYVEFADKVYFVRAGRFAEETVAHAAV